MALVGLDKIMPVLEKRKICLPAIDIAGGHPDFLLGALRAFEETACPALFIVYAPMAKYVGLEACTHFVRFFCRRISNTGGAAPGPREHRRTGRTGDRTGFHQHHV